ncbi:HAMP domain-containing sensor histidine kinase [uncultured Arcobacter sp.]|uniref:sensor histidine kinase n=1 Tax=uncultured Arcobacter sp. TaxID=165434 RepID=UPI0026160944|nr:HAMP domain-containing sensor histidine kinase [uncultured Arcobacter sp.]
MNKEKEAKFYELLKKNKELQNIINKEIEKNREKDKIMFSQNKMAALGEMLNNISHQWRQPLMELSSLFIPLEGKINLGVKVEQDEIKESIEKLNDITKYMSNTIDDFRNFFATNKEISEFKLLEQINIAYKLMSGSFKANNISLEIFVSKNPKVLGYKNEYTQVLINLLNNAKDALIQRKIENPKIIIRVKEYEKEIILNIEDNAGGIDVSPLEEIFKPFFTHGKKNGTGIGLFMSKLIIENNMHGKLLVNNTNNGAEFKIITYKKDQK